MLGAEDSCELDSGSMRQHVYGAASSGVEAGLICEKAYALALERREILCFENINSRQHRTIAIRNVPL